jgi:hypothetical protein
MLGIAKCLQDSNAAIRSLAADTLLELHQACHIECWGPLPHFLITFWQIR